MLIKLKDKYKISLKDDCRGISLVELLVGVSLLSAVLMILYAFLSFTFNSMIYTQAKYDATQDARIVMIEIGDNLRKSQPVRIGATNHKAVEVSAGGNQIDIYVDHDNDNDLELVRYKLDGDKLVVGYAELGFSPTSWHTLIESLYNSHLDVPVPIFTIDDKTVHINIYLKDEYENMSEPLSVSASFTVRSKGAIN